MAPAWLLEWEVFDESESEVVVAAGIELVDVDPVEVVVVAEAVEEVDSKPKDRKFPGQSGGSI